MNDMHTYDIPYNTSFFYNVIQKYVGLNHFILTGTQISSYHDFFYVACNIFMFVKHISVEISVFFFFLFF